MSDARTTVSAPSIIKVINNKRRQYMNSERYYEIVLYDCIKLTIEIMLTIFKRENVGIYHNNSDIIIFSVNSNIFMSDERKSKGCIALCKRSLCEFNRINKS